MRRRTVAILMVILGVAGGCSSGSEPGSAPAVVSAPPTTESPSPAATKATNKPKAAPRSSGRTMVTPPAGIAPTTTFAIEERKLSLRRGAARPLPTTVWAPVGGGPYPLVLFSHGLTSEPSAYASVLTAWAKAGFVVAAPAYPHTSYGVKNIDPLDIANQPADASYVISEVLKAYQGRIDDKRIAAAGHSAGGITTIGMFTGSRDDRLVAGIVLAGERVLLAPFTGPAAPLLFVHGKLDNTVPYARGLAAYNAVPWSRAMLTVTAGGHVAITKDFTPVIATTTDFLRWSLYGDPAAKARLYSDATKGGDATFNDQL
jgi:dienelactone hydrolase